MRKIRHSYPALLIFTILASAFAASAQTAKPTPPIPDDDGEVIKVDSRLIVVPVSVTDANGEPVLGLTAKDFRLSEENRNQVIDNVGGAEVVPLDIAVLFDVSASTDTMFRFEQETAAAFLRDVMKENDRASIFTVGQKPMMIQPRDTAERSIASILSIFPQKGATAYFDTVRAATTYLNDNAPAGRRRVIVVISDGDDNFSVGLQKVQRATERKIVDGSPDVDLKKLGSLVLQSQQAAKVSERAKVLKGLQDADTVHYSINPGGSSYLLNKMSVFGQENLQLFADATGGTAFLPKFSPVDLKDKLQNDTNTRKNKELLVRIFRQLTNELRSQYLVQYYSDATYPVNKFVKLEVGLEAKPAAKIRARQGYYVTN